MAIKQDTRIHRTTMFKVPDPENQRKLTEAYQTLSKTQVKVRFQSAFLLLYSPQYHQCLECQKWVYLVTCYNPNGFSSAQEKNPSIPWSFRDMIFPIQSATTCLTFIFLPQSSSRWGLKMRGGMHATPIHPASAGQ